MNPQITPNNFLNWIPYRLSCEDQQALVDWCYMGETRFCEPFFEDTIRKQMREPFSLLFRYRTPFSHLRNLYEQFPGIPPTGFIFHLSRCGSTLISQMLAALPENIVVSEAPPIDFVIRNQTRHSNTDFDEQAADLKWLLNTFGQKRYEKEKYLFIKFDCWNALDLELITQAFPNVPWMFLYRNPVEVIVSHLRQPGMQMIPGAIEDLLPAMDLSGILQMSREEYYARVLGQICQSVLKHVNDKNSLIVNYSQLPEAVADGVIKHFKVNYPAKNIEKMNAAAQFNAKAPQLSFSSDVREKNKEATEVVRQSAQEFALPYYLKLEDVRLAQGNKSLL